LLLASGRIWYYPIISVVNCSLDIQVYSGGILLMRVLFHCHVDVWKLN
jgi:hypothetical protein